MRGQYEINIKGFIIKYSPYEPLEGGSVMVLHDLKDVREMRAVLLFCIHCHFPPFVGHGASR